jgi:hypothetical protein
MTTKRSKSSRSDTSGAKWFLTAASLAGVLGGWVAFSLNPGSGSDPASQNLASNLRLDPIPTVVQVSGSQDRRLGSSTGSASQTALRSVSAPAPAPITVTRSSR